MNILFLQDHGGVGGAQLSLFDLVKGFKTFTSSVRPHVIVGEKGFLFDRLASLGISVEFLPVPGYRKATHFFKRRAFVTRLANICKERQIEVIHANNHQVAPWSALVAKEVGIPSCCTVQEIITRATARKYLVDENERVIAISKAIEQPLGFIPAEKTTQVYPGIDIPDFITPDDEILSKLGVPKGPGKRVVFMGTLSERKGPQILVEAIPAVLRDAPRTQFIFIGTGKNEFVRTLQSRVKALQVSDSVVFTGCLEDGARYLRLFDIFVLASMNEPLGRVTVEAMYAELPIVATDTGGTREFLDHGKTGRLLPPQMRQRLTEEILFLLKNDRDSQGYGRTARQRAIELFHPARYARAMENVYGEMRRVS